MMPRAMPAISSDVREDPGMGLTGEVGDPEGFSAVGIMDCGLPGGRTPVTPGGSGVPAVMVGFWPAPGGMRELLGLLPEGRIGGLGGRRSSLPVGGMKPPGSWPPVISGRGRTVVVTKTVVVALGARVRVTKTVLRMVEVTVTIPVTVVTASTVVVTVTVFSASRDTSLSDARTAGLVVAAPEMLAIALVRVVG